MTGKWSKAPVGPHAHRWSTVADTRKVLFVVHTVASANRLGDLVDLFDSDLRVQLVHTCPDAASVPAGVEEHLVGRGFAVITWGQAVNTVWDLVITANTSGGLHELDGPVVLVSHGIGYTKTIPPGGPEARRPGGPEARRPGGPEARRPVYGLSAESLFSGGRLLPSVLVLSHEEQLERLAGSVAAAVERAVVAGDPRFDRMLASLDERDRYRAALGVGERDTLVVVSSTWWQRSLFGGWPELLAQLLAELPVDRFRVAAVLHPHIWFGHGPAVVRSWLARCLRAGLLLVPPEEGWSAALIASDVVVGDHGAVTTYAAALGRPVLLGAFPAGDVAEGTAVHVVGGVAPRLDRSRPVRAQVEDVLARRLVDPAPVADLVTSVPGKAAHLLREVCYEALGLPVPELPVPVPVLPDPVVDGPRGGLAMRVHGTIDPTGVVELARHPADALLGRGTAHPLLPETHLVAAADHPLPELRGGADIVFRRSTDPRWLDTAADRHPFAALAAAVTSSTECVVQVRNGPRAHCRVPPGVDPLLAASALYLLPHHPTSASLRIRTDNGDAVTVTVNG
ncbi:hypothetical protein ACOBQX_02935 [Actinokineospora sp. G85]|uniref:hypothetical protein n=1 Tax=Actinokineospora sp. G85 TaxID=3406626 RepID=UPI003C76979C